MKARLLVFLLAAACGGAPASEPDAAGPACTSDAGRRRGHREPDAYVPRWAQCATFTSNRSRESDAGAWRAACAAMTSSARAAGYVVLESNIGAISTAMIRTCSPKSRSSSRPSAAGPRSEEGGREVALPSGARSYVGYDATVLARPSSERTSFRLREEDEFVTAIHAAREAGGAPFVPVVLAASPGEAAVEVSP